jgi:hypothetical protein
MTPYQHSMCKCCVYVAPLRADLDKEEISVERASAQDGAFGFEAS